jgi:hypothetical protein
MGPASVAVWEAGSVVVVGHFTDPEGTLVGVAGA